ncbi:MAG TPA: response regulator transcription factor [Terriglobales bacterium]|nr:response regulator transcription factor [Terriglobales bacterium]
MSPMIKVAIIEDQPEVREGLRILIDTSAGFRCTSSDPSMERGLESMGQTPPDVALVDIGLPGMSGLEGIRRMREIYPSVLALMLTVYNDDDRIFEAMCAGACGYLLKNTRPERLLQAIAEAADGGAPMSPEVARRVVALFRQFEPPKSAGYHLTAQEQRLLKLLGDGHHYKTAAAEMNLSVHTVHFHMRAIYQKLQVHSKSEAVAKALRDRLIR